MKRLAVAIILATVATSAYASCVMHTIMQNGSIVTCQTCCFGRNCNTTCI